MNTNAVAKYLGMPPVAAEHAYSLDALLGYVHLLMGALFVGWLGYFIYVIYRFRQSKNPKADYHGVKNNASSYVEGLVAVVEAVLLIFFAVPLWAKAVDKFPDAKDSLVLNVIGSQFSWRARYPGPDKVFAKQSPNKVTTENPNGLDLTDPAVKDDFEVLNDIVVPLGKDVIMNITSMDVIHCFAVKPMRVTQDAIPGIRIATHFKATMPGVFPINCAQLCGNSHYAMKGTLTVKTQAEFDEWMLKRAQTGGAGAGSYE